MEFNNEKHLKPIFSTNVFDSFNETDDDQECKEHYKGLFLDIQKQLGCKIEDIVDFDLCFADTQGSQVVGLNKEFLSAPRLDNLFSSWAAIRSIGEDNNMKNSADINFCAMFDHEEIGSQTTTGANSQLLPSIIERIYNVLGGEKANKDNLFATYQRSYMIQADMAHGLHPNYSAKHQKNHMVMPNQGVVIKINANNRYTSNALSSQITKEIAKKAGVPIQPFIVRADSRCGSTIGPMLSSRTGIMSVDVGCCQFAMHSIRESCGVLDAHYYCKYFEEFYQNEIPKIEQ